jgi:hypothetical protein
MLHLEDNHICGAELPEHLGSLHISALLEEVHLGSNSLGDRGAILLAQQLGGSTTGTGAATLVHLDLHDCGIAEQGEYAVDWLAYCVT